MARRPAAAGPETQQAAGRAPLRSRGAGYLSAHRFPRVTRPELMPFLYALI
jgi:hypothetical protein